MKKLLKEFKRLSTGINSPGGKWRLLIDVLARFPYHEYYLEPFLGSGIVGINKPRCRYEVFNDKFYEIYNYFYVLKYHYKEFRRAKRGIYELVCEKCYEDIKKGIIKPIDRIERAVIFRYMNKLTRAGLNQLVQSKFRDMLPPTNSKKNVIEKVKEDYKNLLFKGIRVNHSRPWTNNDNGLITPIDLKVIEALQYVTLTCQDFRDAYKTFYQKYHVERNLSKVCFMYWDPVYPGKEKPYYHKFKEKDHLDVINILLDTPFKFELSIGGDCDFYLDAFREVGYRIDPITNKYSTNAKHQKEITEYLVMNYNPEKVPLMSIDNQPNLMEFIEV